MALIPPALAITFDVQLTIAILGIAFLLFSGIIIDLFTLLVFYIYKAFKNIFLSRKEREEQAQKIAELTRKYDVSVIIPAYNEEKNIEKTITNAFNQTHKPKEVIVIDDCSTDATHNICVSLKKKYPNLNIVRQKTNKGKAYNITYILNKFNLSEITIVLDADTFLSENYIEEIVKPLADPRVAISSGKSLPVKSPNKMGKMIYRGSVFQYRFFCFRKHAQSLRNAISVVCGDSAAYRTSFLKEMNGFPQGTQTEDMDISWQALEQGYKVTFSNSANATSQDANTLKGHWKQISRWYAGGFQCLAKHKTQLFKAKSLLYTTLVPSYLDSFTYAGMFLASIPLLFFFPTFAIAFLVADFIFTLIAIIYLDWKGLVHLLEIYFIKIVWSLAWFYAAFKTLYQIITGKKSWSGAWTRDFYKKTGNK